MRGLGRLAIGLAIVVGGAVAAAPNALAAPPSCSSNPVPSKVRTNSALDVPLVLLCHGTSVSIVTPPAHGTLAGPPEYPLYTPSPGFTGMDEVTFRVSNADGSSGDLTWSFEVADDAGYAPQCGGGAPPYVRNNGPVPIDLICWNQQLDEVHVAIVTPPQHGTLSTVQQGPFEPVGIALMPSATQSTATVTYTADPGYTGPDSFQVAGDDGHFVGTAQSVSFNVTDGAVNHPPVCTIGSGLPIAADDTTLLSAYCGDADGDAYTITTTQQPIHGTLGSWNRSRNFGDQAAYTPEPGFTGSDSITIQATDARGASSTPASATFAIQDGPLPTTILCAAQLLGVTRNVSLTTQGAVCFSHTGPAATSITDAPSHGTATITPTGQLRYTPDRNYIGPDTLTLHATAGSATHDTPVVVSVTSKAKVTILSGPPSTSTATTQTFSLYGEAGVTLTCALSNSGASTPQPCAGTKTYTGTPAGDHVLTVTATDGQGRTSTDTYAFTVTEAAPPAGGGGGAPAGGSGGSSAPATKGVPDTGQGAGVTEPSPPPAVPQPASAGSATAEPTAAAPRDPLGWLVAPRPKLRTLLKAGRITLPFTAPAPGRISVRWTVVDPSARHGRVLVATGRARAPHAGDATVTVRLTRTGRALLRHKRRAVRISASATFRPDGAAAITRSATFRLR